MSGEEAQSDTECLRRKYPICPSVLARGRKTPQRGREFWTMILISPKGESWPGLRVQKVQVGPFKLFLRRVLGASKNSERIAVSNTKQATWHRHVHKNGEREPSSSGFLTASPLFLTPRDLAETSRDLERPRRDLERPRRETAVSPHMHRTAARRPPGACPGLCRRRTARPPRAQQPAPLDFEEEQDGNRRDELCVRVSHRPRGLSAEGKRPGRRQNSTSRFSRR